MSRRFCWLLIAPALLGAGAFLFGCAPKPAVGPGPSPAAKPAEDFILHVPCVLSMPFQRVLVAYDKVHPEAKVRLETSKPLALVDAVTEAHSLPGLAVTLGEVEMQALVREGAVKRAQVRPFARNTYPIAAIVPSSDTATRHWADLANLRRVAVEDPALSTLGARAKDGLTKLGLWTKLERKVVRLDPSQNVLSQLLDGKAEAAVVFRDCLISEGGAAPKTVRIVGTLPNGSFSPIVYQVAPLAAPAPTKQVQDFLAYLASANGKRTLQQAGLTPL